MAPPLVYYMCLIFETLVLPPAVELLFFCSEVESLDLVSDDDTEFCQHFVLCLNLFESGGLFSDFTMALQKFLGYDAELKSARNATSFKNNYLEDLPTDNYVDLPMPPAALAENVRLTDSATGKRIEIHINKGTTTFGFKFQGGIILAVDSRATAGGFISQSEVMKFIPITKYLVGTMAGGAADCQYWHRVLSVRARLHELRNKERMSVAAASKVLSNILYSYKG